MKKYDVSHDYHELFSIEIEESAAEAIKESVHFWLGAEENLNDYDWDYNKAFLRNLGNHMMIFGEFPWDQEGYFGSREVWEKLGIKVSRIDPIRDFEIDIEECK